MNQDNVLDTRTAFLSDLSAMAGRATTCGPHAYKTAELEGPLLDLAVANAAKIKAVIHLVPNAIEPIYECCVLNESGRLQHQYQPSRNWVYGGPIIDAEYIGVMPVSDAWWRAGDVDGAGGFGPTALVAAMRCFVAAKFGPEVML